MEGSNFEAVMGNWIALSRDVASHWLVGFGQSVSPANPNRGAYSRSEAWIDLIMLARWKPGTEVNKGKRIELDVGQLQGGYSFLALRWNWTLKQVRLFLDKLVIERMIDKGQPENCLPSACPSLAPAKKQGKQQGNQVQVITLCNYRKYQIAWEVTRLMEGQAEGKPGASQGQDLNTVTRKQEETLVLTDLSPDQGQDDDRMTASKAAKMAFELYNETAKRCGLPQCRILNDARKRALALRVREVGGIDGFKQAMANLEKSAYCRGENERGWVATIDYVCQPKGFAKLYEGGWGNGTHGKLPVNSSRYDHLYDGVL